MPETESCFSANWTYFTEEHLIHSWPCSKDQPHITDFDVDIVFTYAFYEPWDKAALEEAMHACPQDGAIRFRDLGILKETLMSVDKFAPWVNRIHVVTRGGGPEWLLANKRVHLVSHAEIWDRRYAK